MEAFEPEWECVDQKTPVMNGNTDFTMSQNGKMYWSDLPVYGITSDVKS